MGMVRKIEGANILRTGISATPLPVGARKAQWICRRNFLKFGASWLGLAPFLATQTGARGDATDNLRGFGKAKSCIVLFCWGGISHLDTWDPKPHAPADIRGEFKPIPTAVDGIQLSEHLPLLARQMRDIAVVRSANHKAPSHRSGAYWNLTGHEPPQLTTDWLVSRRDWPCIGSLITAAHDAQQRPRPLGGALPRAMCLPYEMVDGGKANGQDGGFLGLTYDPMIVRPPRGKLYGGKSPISSAVDLGLLPDLSESRIISRRALLASLEGTSRAGAPGDTQATARVQEQAMDMLLSPAVREAFDLDKEPRRLQEAYGDHICGQSVLLARRLTGAGVPIVTVYCAAGDLDGSSGDHFDTHGNNFNRLKRDLLPPLDRASSALVEDLRQRGKLDETLIVWLTEFGRTPKINGSAGRDHFPTCYSVAFAGGGIRGGQVYGASNSIGFEPASDACGPADLHATIFHSLGIAPHQLIRDLDGRPHPLCEGKPLPLFG